MKKDNFFVMVWDWFYFHIIKTPIYYFRDFGILVGLYRLVVRKWDEEVFVDKMLNYMLKDNTNIDLKYILSLPKLKKSESPEPGKEYQDDWYVRYSFKDKNHYEKFKKHFLNEYRKHLSNNPLNKESSRHLAELSFSYFNLMWGLHEPWNS